MSPWTELETQFRALSPELDALRLDVQWGTHGTRLTLAGFGNRRQEEFERLSAAAGKLLRDLLNPDDEKDAELLAITHDAERWYFQLAFRAGRLADATYGWLTNDAGEKTGSLNFASVQAVIAVSATECMRLERVAAGGGSWSDRYFSKRPQPSIFPVGFEPRSVTATTTRARSILPRLGVLAVIAVLVSAVALILYGITFPNWLSRNASDWGLFGDYVGGTLGTVFAMAAFIGVLVTVYLQSEQLDTIKKQANIDELQRLLATLSARIDERMDAPSHALPPRLASAAQRTGSEVTLNFLLSAAGTKAIDTTGKFSGLVLGEIQSDIIKAIEHDVAVLCQELQQLVWCLEEYKEAGGSDSVSTFYERRYAVIVAWIEALMLLSSERVRKYFKPARQIESMREPIRQ